MSSRLFGCSIRLLAQCRLFLLRLSMGSSQSVSARLFYLRVGADTVFFGVCMSLEVHRFVSVFMFSLSSFCAQAKPMRDEPVCLCVCVAQTFYLFYLCLSICALWCFATLRFVCANENNKALAQLAKIKIMLRLMPVALIDLLAPGFI